MMSRAGISPTGRTELASILTPGRRFVTPQHVADVLGIDPSAAAKRLARWAEEGWLRRARRGLYIPVPVDATDPAAWSEDALIVAEAVWSPCYFTGWTAANHWALTDQIFRTTVLKTTGRVRASSVQVLDHDYLVRHVSAPNIEWGVKKEWQAEVRLLFADPARTVIDILDSPALGGGVRHGAEILVAYLDDHDPALLIEYGDRLENRTVFKRLGYLLEVLGTGHTDLIEACRDRISAGVSLLEPDGPKRGRRAMRWNLRLNAVIRPEDPA